MEKGFLIRNGFAPVRLGTVGGIPTVEWSYASETWVLGPGEELEFDVFEHEGDRVTLNIPPALGQGEDEEKAHADELAMGVLLYQRDVETYGAPKGAYRKAYADAEMEELVVQYRRECPPWDPS
jgi:hypothetical protein